LLKDWPPVATYAVTRSQPQASVAVQTHHGDPLIAFQRFGQGRVIAVTSGLGRWTPRWLPWGGWPRLAGGMTDWISGTAQGAELALTVTDLPAGLQIDVDAGTGSPAPGSVSIAMQTPAKQDRPVIMDEVALGRLRAMPPDAGPGLYTFQASSPLGTLRQLHLRRSRAENESWGTNPALDAWKTAGLVGVWDPEVLARNRVDGPAPRPADRSLIGLALALFLAGVVVDRRGWRKTGQDRQDRRKTGED
jgi:hypothetical protein